MARKSYPMRKPRFAAGIRAQESRTGSGRSWWFKEWIRRLETMGMNGRLGRGKNYAMSGQVVSLEIAGNRVKAVVQGARQDPYDVSIVFRLPDEEAEKRIVTAIRREPMLVARLLADDLPTEIERIFPSRQTGLHWSDLPQKSAWHPVPSSLLSPPERQSQS